MDHDMKQNEKRRMDHIMRHNEKQRMNNCISQWRGPCCQSNVPGSLAETEHN
jgi:hypothetical protein